MIAFVPELVAHFEREARRITQEKDRKALLPREVDTLKADAFLRKIAPYLYEKPADQ